MKKIKIILLIMIVIILTVIIESNSIAALDQISDVTSTMTLAKFIATKPEEFWNATIEEIFALNSKKTPYGYYGLDSNPSDTKDEDVDIYYHTAACIFHDQANNNGDGYQHKITNIIEIETPGTMKVYQYTGSNGSVEYDQANIDVNLEENAKAVYDTLMGNNLVSSDVIFKHEKMKHDITAFAYLLYDTTVNAQNADPIASSSYEWTTTKGAIEYTWKQPGAYLAVRKYAMASGKLDSYYYDAEGTNTSVTMDAAEKREEALQATQSLLVQPKINSVDLSKIPEVTYQNDKAYIGPLKVNYEGGTPTIKINIGTSTENWVTASGWATMNTDKTFNTIQTGTLTSGQEFYVVIDQAKVETLSKFSVKVDLAYTQYKARVALTTAKSNGSQNLMFFMGKKIDDVIPVTWEVEQTKKVTIQKQDASGNALKASGIKFEVYDSNNTKVGTLTTDATGNTNSIGLKREEEYTLKETVNTVYGYGNASMEDAIITSGGTIISKNSDEVKFSITEDSTITIKNSPDLGNLTIKKVDENGNPMEGVEFIIWQNLNWGYININGEAEHTTPTTGTDIKALYEAGNISGGGGTLTEMTTRYVTNKKGEIVLNNLEIYHSKGEKYNYVIREMSNENYGYKAMIMADSDITLSEADSSTIKGSFVGDMYGTDEIIDGGKDTLRKKAQFTLGENTVVEIKNTPKLGKLVVHKKGNDDSSLENAEFTLYKAVGDGIGYLKLGDEPLISTEVDVKDYNVTYVKTAEEATKFKTNSEGKIIINNLEIYSGIDSEYNPVKYNYWLCEESNNVYGFKGLVMSESDVSIEGGTIEDDTTDEDTKVDTANREIRFTINDDSTLVEAIIENHLQLGELELIKCDADNAEIKLSGVEFKIQITSGDLGEFLALYDKDGNWVDYKEGTATINQENKANSTEYHLEYVDTEEEATTFITDGNGKINIKNLEVYSGEDTKYVYKISEISNLNYGYSVETSAIEAISIELTPGTVTSTTLTNSKALGGIYLEKVDEDYSEIKLEDIEFVLSIDKNVNTYVALYKDGKFVESVKGTNTIINTENVSNDTEYEVRYIQLDKPYLEYLENERKNLGVTVLKTDVEGKLLINNLEVINDLTDEKYTYRLTETYNPYYGYEVLDGSQYYETTLNEGELIKWTLEEETPIQNPPEKMKISGYVWIENSEGKAGQYNCVYTNSSNDMKLTDLYIKQNGKIIKNPDAIIPVEIKLYDTTTSTYIRTKPDEFDTTTGKYTFTEVDIPEEMNSETESYENRYKVVFSYDGFYYTTIVPNTEVDNGSKAVEVEEDRTILNNQFGTVKPENKMVNVEGTKVSEIQYAQQSITVNSTTTNSQYSVQASVVSAFEFETLVRADTIINIVEEFHTLKDNSSIAVAGVDNINMGLMLREQPILGIGSDIHSVLVEKDEYNYTYYYEGRTEHYENTAGNEIGVKFEQEGVSKRYSRNVYSTDIDEFNEGRTTMGVSVIYKISLSNNSQTLTSVIHEIANYFDSDYSIEAIGLGIDENRDSNTEVVEITDVLSSNMWEIQENVPVQGLVEEGKSYNAVKIMLTENGIKLLKSQSQNIYIKFNVSEDAIKSLLNENSTYHNATEIMSYSTYYGETTGQGEVINANEEVQITDLVTENLTTTTSTGRRTGQPYAGIDRSSRPGNIVLELIADPLEQGSTPILNIEHFEDDTTSAPAFLLQAVDGGARIITGNVYEDLENYTENNEKLGNGIFDEGEKGIQNVLVTLREVNDNGSIGAEAKYSDGETLAITESDENGYYKLGYYDEEKGEYIGISPGRYVIEYTYGKYVIDDEEKQSYIVGKENINIIDYKSTIIVSDDIKNAFVSKEDGDVSEEDKKYEKWFAMESNSTRYSDVRDDIDLRPEYDIDFDAEFSVDEPFTIKYSTYGKINENETMIARTPVMNVGIEFTEEDKQEALYTDEEGNLRMKPFAKELGNVDVGIIERPDVDITIDKEITSLEIISQTGSSIIPKGNPSDLNSRMQYVKNLDDEVSAEIESKLLQGAVLNLEYTITATNNSDRDYLNKDYYYYGTLRENENTARPKLIVDYLDASMKLDESKNDENIWEETTAQELLDNGFISELVFDELSENEVGYYILTTSAFENVELGGAKSEKVYATKVLAISDSIDELNRIEVIEITGRRPITAAIPGNYVPSESATEPDEDEVSLTVLPPTGTTVDYTLYTVAVVAMLIILVGGIVIIKKKIIV